MLSFRYPSTRFFPGRLTATVYLRAVPDCIAFFFFICCWRSAYAEIEKRSIRFLYMCLAYVLGACRCCNIINWFHFAKWSRRSVLRVVSVCVAWVGVSFFPSSRCCCCCYAVSVVAIHASMVTWHTMHTLFYFEASGWAAAVCRWSHVRINVWSIR